MSNQKSNKFTKKYSSLIIAGIAMVLWLFLVLIFTNYEKTEAYFYGGLSFGILSFLIYSGVIYYLGTRNTMNNPETKAIPHIVAAGYLIIAVIINTIIIMVDMGQEETKIKPVIIPNVIVILLFAVVMVVIVRYFSRTGALGEKIAQSTNAVASYKGALASCIEYTDDPEIKVQLRELKKRVDYCSNVSSPATHEIELEFEDQIRYIKSMIREEKSKEEILKAVRMADKIWSDRMIASETR